MTAIRGDDRVADVLERDEALIDVFESVSPAFGRLRKPAMRKVMTRLVTVTQAARVAGVDPGVLIERLNAATGVDEGRAPSSDPSSREKAGEMAEQETRQENGMPEELAALPEDRIVELDVREDLREGKEPFSRIMAARAEVPEGGALMLRAIFEPAPLYAVLGKQGWSHWTEERGAEDWVVWFYRGTEAEAGDRTGTGARTGTGTRTGDEEDGAVVLDVRGLEPPEPMVRTLAALESLPRGETLVQINVREPRFLLPQLEERGFEYEVREQSEDLVRVFIRHREG